MGKPWSMLRVQKSAMSSSIGRCCSAVPGAAALADVCGYRLLTHELALAGVCVQNLRTSERLVRSEWRDHSAYAYRNGSPGSEGGSGEV